MKITVLQPPPFEPVTLAEVHKHLRLDLDGSPASHPDDDMLQRLIATARGKRGEVIEFLESMVGKPYSVAQLFFIAFCHAFKPLNKIFNS